MLTIPKMVDADVKSFDIGLTESDANIWRPAQSKFPSLTNGILTSQGSISRGLNDEQAVRPRTANMALRNPLVLAVLSNRLQYIQNPFRLQSHRHD